MILAPWLLFFAAAEPETADAIMARVAVNQDRAQQMRTAFVYHQTVLVRLNRGNGKLAREEYSEFTVAPAGNVSRKERTLFSGRYVEKGKEVAFDEPGWEHKGIDIDAAIAGSLAEDLANDAKSRDGIASDLFPLTATEQAKYSFRLEGTEDYRGADVFRITFSPKKSGEDEGDWAGEALIDRREYQPVLVTTRLATKIPVLVKTLLGTDLQHLGFKVAYKKFDEGLWFPVTYGGEFKVRALFLYTRRVGLAVQNSGFQRAAVESKVLFGAVETTGAGSEK